MEQVLAIGRVPISRTAETITNVQSWTTHDTSSSAASAAVTAAPTANQIDTSWTVRPSDTANAMASSSQTIGAYCCHQESIFMPATLTFIFYLSGFCNPDSA